MNGSHQLQNLTIERIYLILTVLPVDIDHGSDCLPEACRDPDGPQFFLQQRKTMNRLLAIGILVTTFSMSGCVGWGPCGNEQFVGPFAGTLEGVCTTCDDHCGSCDGCLPVFGNLRKTLACGSGCGEIYYGEWMSNPPNTCNECDARGHAFGAPSRIPWLCNPFPLWGYQYGQRGGGYGNPLRGTHPGLADYGGFWPGYFQPVGCVDGSCGGCASGDCQSNAPETKAQKLKPIPKQNGPTKNRPTGKQVSHHSPLDRLPARSPLR